MQCNADAEAAWCGEKLRVSVFSSVVPKKSTTLLVSILMGISCMHILSTGIHDRYPGQVCADINL